MAGHDQFGYDENRSFARRYGFAIGGGVVALIVVVAVVQLFSGHGDAPAPRHEDMVMIRTLPPPPTPPPVTPPPVTPPPQDEPKQQMIEQTQDSEPVKPAETPAEQPQAMGSNIQGNGPPDGFGLSGHGNGMTVGGGSGRGGGSKYGWYAAEIVSALGDALRRNDHTRDASFNIKVRIWSDPTGRVTRAKLAGSTGDPVLDNAIQNEVLTGFQLKEPPPDGMPMPIVMRLAARRPN
jgi:TonB family protein